MMALRVHYVYNADLGQWCFSVPSLDLVGSAATRSAAELEAEAAILTALRDEGSPSNVPNTEVGYFHLTLERAVIFAPA